MVKEEKHKPTGPHYAAILFGTRSEYDPPYDEKDRGSSYTVPEITYFAFKEEQDLKQWIAEATQERYKFFFYRVEKLGEIKVDINLTLK
jgi:hypothetical protein